MNFLKDRDKATIEKGNILSDGYGLSPQLVARDSWLTTGARAYISIYPVLQEQVGHVIHLGIL